MPSIITMVWYALVGDTLSLAQFWQGFMDLRTRLNAICAESCAETHRHSLRMFAERCRFYIDLWVVGVLSLGASVGVMMRILWGNPGGAFGGTRSEKLRDSTYMTLAFVLVTVVSAI